MAMSLGQGSEDTEVCITPSPGSEERIVEEEQGTQHIRLSMTSWAHRASLRRPGEMGRTRVVWELPDASEPVERHLLLWIRHVSGRCPEVRGYASTILRIHRPFSRDNFPTPIFTSLELSHRGRALGFFIQRCWAPLRERRRPSSCQVVKFITRATPLCCCSVVLEEPCNRIYSSITTF